jgi:anti-sigma28 factor (negative regulator of flagellin synthesis)
MLIKAMEGGSESQIDTSMMLMEDSSRGTERMQQALAATLRMMERTIATAGENLHFQRPIEKNKMEAIRVLIEEGNKKMKMGSITRKMTAQVGLDA